MLATLAGSMLAASARRHSVRRTGHDRDQFRAGRGANRRGLDAAAPAKGQEETQTAEGRPNSGGRLGCGEWHSKSPICSPTGPSPSPEWLNDRSGINREIHVPLRESPEVKSLWACYLTKQVAHILQVKEVWVGDAERRKRYRQNFTTPWISRIA